MQTQAAKLSSKGKVAIPKEIIAKHRWKSGQELEVIETDDGISSFRCSSVLCSLVVVATAQKRPSA
jgi:AbrB family looped-hinge helix DNA binding protein